MAERIPDAGGDEEYRQILAGLADDKEFTGVMEGLDDAMDIADLSRPLVPSTVHEQYQRPHAEQPLDVVVAKLNDAFKRLCREYNVNPKIFDASDEKYLAIQEDLAAELYKLKDEIYSGDILIATNALALDFNENSEDPRFVTALSGNRIVGTFCAPIIGPMPADMSALRLNDTDSSPLGVGLMVTNPLIIDPDGNAHRGDLQSDCAIISLSFSGNKLARCRFPAGF